MWLTTSSSKIYFTYLSVCVCVCVRRKPARYHDQTLSYRCGEHTHTHTEREREREALGGGWAVCPMHVGSTARRADHHHVTTGLDRR